MHKVTKENEAWHFQNVWLSNKLAQQSIEKSVQDEWSIA